HALPRQGLQRPAGREDPGARRASYRRAAAEGLRGHDAGRDPGGRVDALRARRDHGTRGRVPPPVDLRRGGLMAVTDDEYENGEPDRRRPVGPPPLHVGRTIEALPGLARIAASSWLHTMQWGASTSWRVTRRLAAAARDPELAAELAQELGTTVAA